MSLNAPAVRGQVLSGHNRIITPALTSLANPAAAHVLDVDVQDVRADWADDDGMLALSLVAPISVPLLRAVVLDRSRLNAFGGSIWDRTVDAKSRSLATVTELSGAQLSRVDIRISGIRTSEGGRVR